MLTVRSIIESFSFLTICVSIDNVLIHWTLSISATLYLKPISWSHASSRLRESTINTLLSQHTLFIILWTLFSTSGLLPERLQVIVRKKEISFSLLDALFFDSLPILYKILYHSNLENIPPIPIHHQPFFTIILQCNPNDCNKSFSKKWHLLEAYANSRRHMFRIRFISNIVDSELNFKFLEFTLRNSCTSCCWFQTSLFRTFFPVRHKYHPLIPNFCEKKATGKISK